MNQLKEVEPIQNFKTSTPTDRQEENAVMATAKKSTQEDRLYVLMGNKIKELRTGQGLSRSDLTLKLEVSSAYLGLIEQGRRGGSDSFLLKLEEFFKLKPKTLVALRDGGIKKDLQKVEVESEADAKVELNPTMNYTSDHSPNQSHNQLQLLISTLSSCDEMYVNQKIPQWLKEIQDDLFNQLTPYKLEELMQHVTTVTKKWITEAEDYDTFTDGTDQIQGCITQDEQKHFFSLQLNEFALTLNVLQKDRHQVQYFEEWLGACSINYSMEQTLPYTSTEEEISHYLWFNPQVSIADMFRYLKNLPVHIDKMQIKEPRLNWYIQEAI